MTAAASMKIDIIVDTICPWCYVGKRRFEKALAMRTLPDVKIGWRPFQLNPDMPAEGIDRRTYLARKFGGVERAAQRYEQLAQLGASEGIDFQFGRMERTPNTVNSHRLIRYAGRFGMQTQVIDAVFRAYFTQGRDIGDVETLADIGAAEGLERAALASFLRSRHEADAVIADDEAARGLGINGVPCYIIEGRYAVSGAQSPEIFVQILDLVQRDRASQAAE
jgi:predicted DsbA family dithiol-disulfide isomerase